MQYTKRYGCPVLFLKDILLFDLTFLKFRTLYCKNRRVKAAHLMCQSNTKYVLKGCPLF